MNIKRIDIILITCAIIAVAGVFTAIVFNTKFARVTIDAWSFAASIFLITEAVYKMRKDPGPFWPYQFFRFVRIVIGTCVFTIHTCQIIYGI